jgi:signal transduction histidine kinase
VVFGFDAAINQGRSIWSDEYRFQRKDGSYAWVFDRGYIIRDAAGKPVRVIGSMMDITERRRTDEMKDTLIAAVAHEFSTPLTSISGYLQLLADGRLGALDPKQEEAVGIIQSAASRMRYSLDKFLRVARLRSGKLSLSKEKLDLQPIIAMAADHYRPLFQKRGIALETHVERLPPLMADRRLLIDVLDNLIDNALKYTEKGRVAVAARRRGDGILITVKDTGIGLSREQLSQVFTEFFRAQEQVGIGAGLGLSICRRIVEMHGGKAWVESKGLRKGSSFHVLLPSVKKRSR